MRSYLAASKILRTGKRALAVALIGLLLGTLAAPATSSAATMHAHATAHSVDRPLDGVGDSPLVP
ncbi:MAG TPA: hypothetical protein VKV73_01710 [Chloroflexota bacterium]|nr:hypothetical protein [Chloroflexota bacterium]